MSLRNHNNGVRMNQPSKRYNHVNTLHSRLGSAEIGTGAGVGTGVGAGVVEVGTWTDVEVGVDVGVDVGADVASLVSQLDCNLAIAASNSLISFSASAIIVNVFLGAVVGSTGKFFFNLSNVA